MEKTIVTTLNFLNTKFTLMITRLDVFPITNQQYLEFIEDGGYKTYKHWLSDGWEKVKENKWTCSYVLGKN